MDATEAVKSMLDAKATIEAIGYLCIQGQIGGTSGWGTRICSGCTSACDQSVMVIIPKP